MDLLSMMHRRFEWTGRRCDKVFVGLQFDASPQLQYDSYIATHDTIHICSARPRAADVLAFVDIGTRVMPVTTLGGGEAGTAQKLVLNSISTTLMVRAGRVHENLMVDLRATNAKLEDRAARIVAELARVERSAAFELLEQASGEVKIAIVMSRCELDATEASEWLAECGGRLERALEGK